MYGLGDTVIVILFRTCKSVLHQVSPPSGVQEHRIMGLIFRHILSFLI